LAVRPVARLDHLDHARSPHLASGLVRPKPFIDDLAQQAIGDPCEKPHLAHSCGFTQWSRARSSGEPNRFVRGGGALSGIFGTRSGGVSLFTVRGAILRRGHRSSAVVGSNAQKKFVNDRDREE
jgi:hypothetical protein